MTTSGAATGRVQLWLGVALLAVLVAFTVLQGEPAAAQPFDPASAAPTGLRALRLWLQAMDYQVEGNDGPAFAIPADCAAIFVFPNQQPYTAEEADTLQRWVQAGGTLVLIGLAPFEAALLDRFLVEPGPSVAEFLVNVEQRQPLLPDLAAPLRINSEPATLDLTQIPAAVPVLLTADGQVTLALQRMGQGVVWHATLHHSLINEQLRDPAQATLVPALLRHAPAGGRIVIDTYHLWGADVAASQSIHSLQDWLYRTSLGWAVLFSLAATLLFVFLQGQRLGPSLPTPETARRREAAEYVTAMANLLRRSQQRAFVADHHKRRLKRTLGRALTVRADLDDATFLHQVAQADQLLPPEAVQSLANILDALEDPRNEADLTQAVRQVDQMLARYQRKTIVK